MLTRILRRLGWQRIPPPVPNRFIDNAEPITVRAITDVPAEVARASEFWKGQSPARYYTQFQPQTLLIIDRFAAMGAKSVFELGCNAGRNLFWIKRTLGASVFGCDVNPDAIAYGHRFFGLSDAETRLGGVDAMRTIPDGSFDAAFTVSVLDHLPDPEPALREMLRIARRVLLVELTLPQFGSVEDPRCVAFSYSHDYDSLLARLPCRITSVRRAPLGEGVIENYTTYELARTTA